MVWLEERSRCDFFFIFFIIIMKSCDRQTSEALWEVTDMLVREMSGLGQSAAGPSCGPCKVLKKIK